MLFPEQFSKNKKLIIISIIIFFIGVLSSFESIRNYAYIVYERITLNNEAKIGNVLINASNEWVVSSQDSGSITFKKVGLSKKQFYISFFYVDGKDDPCRGIGNQLKISGFSILHCSMNKRGEKIGEFYYLTDYNIPLYFTIKEAADSFLNQVHMERLEKAIN